MFRFGGAFRSAGPQAAFAQGAKSAFFMGQWISRRHCSRAHTPLVGGFIDPKTVIGDCAVRAQITAIQSGGILSVYELAQLTALCSGGAAVELSALFAEGGVVPFDGKGTLSHYSLLATFGRVVVRCVHCIKHVFVQNVLIVE